MLKRIYMLALLSMGIGSVAQAQVLCPGQNGSSPTNLACEFADATSASGAPNSSLQRVPTTIASQLGQLPLVSAVSGSGLTLNKSLGVFTASENSLGSILTQRGETMGRHNFLASFTYQHFGFGSIDGVSLHNIQTVQEVTYCEPGTKCAPGSPVNVQQVTNIHAKSDVSLTIDQYTILAGFGLTSKVDLVVIVPISRVGLSTVSTLTYYPVLYSDGIPTAGSSSTATRNLPGAASGLGDVALDLKANVFNGEKLKIAAGGEVRFPTGDAANYLGTGSYGLKPYLVVSGHGRLTPNVNLAYQWNGRSILNENKNLPASFQYSGGVDFRVTRKFTLVGEFLGQYVINGARLNLTTAQIQTATGTITKTTIHPYTGSYAVDNLGGGFKANPFKHLTVNVSVLFKLDDGGLRSKIIPLAGASYRF